MKLLAALLLSLLSLNLACAMELMVPLYGYPSAKSPLWNGVAAAAAAVTTTAILNPDNGPGAGPDANYVAGIAKMDAAGVTLIGYIPTGYGDRTVRPIEGIKRAMDAYKALYPSVKGVFLDEFSTDLGYLADAAELYDYAKSLGYSVTINPGTNIPEVFSACCDCTLTYESGPKGWSSYALSGHEQAAFPESLGVIVYNAGTVAAMQQAISLAAQRNFGVVYVTPDRGANPYDTIPSYWTEEVAEVAAINAR